MALLTLSNEGAPAHFFHLMEAPTMRLPNVKILICWSSRMQIYGFVENHTFLEQFVRMGVSAQFSNLGVPAQFFNLGVPAHFWCISLVHVFLCNFLDYTVTLAPYMHGYNMVQIDGGERPESSESRHSLYRTTSSERRRGWAFTLMCRRDPSKTSSES